MISVDVVYLQGDRFSIPLSCATHLTLVRSKNPHVFTQCAWADGYFTLKPQPHSLLTFILMAALATAKLSSAVNLSCKLGTTVQAIVLNPAWDTFLIVHLCSARTATVNRQIEHLLISQWFFTAPAKSRTLPVGFSLLLVFFFRLSDNLFTTTLSRFQDFIESLFGPIRHFDRCVVLLRGK